MAYIDTKYLGKCETCRHCKGEIKCDTFCDAGECYSPNLSKIPTADVVEVVRCKDCKFCKSIKGCEGISTPYCDRTFAKPDVALIDFCSFGERKPQKR